MTPNYFRLHHFKVLGALQVEIAGKDSPTLELQEHDWLSIEAPSGFGKTTLLRGLLGLEKTEGEFWLDERRIDGLPPQKREIGMAFQDHLLFPHLTAAENVAFGLQIRGVKKSEALSEAHSLMKVLGMGDKNDAPIRVLSGGERQRLTLLRAMIWKPKLLILDEPFKGLDDTAKAQALRLLTQFNAQNRTAVLCVSHPSEQGADLSSVNTAKLVGTASGGATHVRKFYCP